MARSKTRARKKSTGKCSTLHSDIEKNRKRFYKEVKKTRIKLPPPLNW